MFSCYFVFLFYFFLFLFSFCLFFFFNDTATTEIYTLSLHDALPISLNDEDVLQKTIPGCQRIKWVSHNQLELEFRVNLGVAKPVLKGDLMLSNVHPASAYTLSGSGRGGKIGRAHV